MVSAIVAILVSLALAYFLAEVVKRVGVPRLVGQIGAGLILGTAWFRGYLFSTDNINIISFLANLGIILLFYYVGLETNFKVFTKNIRQSVLISLFNTMLPLIVGFLIMNLLFGFSAFISLIIGICLAVSAQSVSVDLLEELRLLKSRIGGKIISAGAVDDVMELLLVGVLFSLFQITSTSPGITGLVLEIFIFIVIVIAARLVFVPLGLKFFDREKSSTARFTGSLLIVLVIAAVAETLSVGFLIGAMVAGMIVRQTIFKEKTLPNWEEHDIARSIHLIAFGFLIPIFFVWIGLTVDLSVLTEQVWFILLLLAIALVGTVGGSLLAVLVNGGSWKEGFLLGWGLSPKGDVELVIASLALGSGIITIELFTSLVMMALLTTIVSPIVFKRLIKSDVN